MKNRIYPYLQIDLRVYLIVVYIYSRSVSVRYVRKNALVPCDPPTISFNRLENRMKYRGRATKESEFSLLVDKQTAGCLDSSIAAVILPFVFTGFR